MSALPRGMFESALWRGQGLCRSVLGSLRRLKLSVSVPAVLPQGSNMQAVEYLIDPYVSALLSMSSSLPQRAQQPNPPISGPLRAALIRPPPEARLVPHAPASAQSHTTAALNTHHATFPRPLAVKTSQRSLSNTITSPSTNYLPLPPHRRVSPSPPGKAGGPSLLPPETPRIDDGDAKLASFHNYKSPARFFPPPNPSFSFSFHHQVRH
jgi:hypothetical protein